MKEIILGILLLTLLAAGCTGGPSGRGSVSTTDISNEDLSADDLSIDLAEDETALPEQIS